ncbi:hypothetical protein ABC347_10370 [Sphingomonas sp. 1P06PA]|uniref:hypothetical protein n=1 Tax=Sphingomonas sp. 1P06PA TaxID=554121 RepID=UPI0039A5A196
MRSAIPIGLVLALISCDTAEPPAQPPRATAVRDRVRAMTPGARNAVFVRAIRDAGQTCQFVANSGYQREQAGLSLWVADCGGDGIWAIYIGETGGAQVARCSVGSDGRPRCGAAG